MRWAPVRGQVVCQVWRAIEAQRSLDGWEGISMRGLRAEACPASVGQIGLRVI